MPLTTAERINVGRLSALYTSNELASGTLHGGQIDKRLPHLIYAVTQGLVWANELLETTANLEKIGNYLISICRHDLRAQGVLSLNNGGTVAPISGGGTTIEDLDFIVSATSYIATGESAVTFDGTGGMPDLRGFNVETFARNGTVQYTTPQAGGALYYSWNRVTGVFQLLSTDPLINPAAQVDESFRIVPDTGATTSSSSTLAPSVIVYPASWEPDGITLNLQYIVDAGEVVLFVSGYNSNFLVAPTNFTYTSTGIVMVDAGFDAANFPFVLIMKIN